MQRGAIMSKKWKVAIIGCGSFANSQYFPNVSKEANAETVAAVDIIPERAQAACAKYGIPNWYSSVYELIEKCDFDIAIDVTSIQAHHEINMAILGAGKHLISQKPAAPTVEMLNEQIELAKKMGVKFSCVPVHPMRFDINVAKQYIDNGLMGKAYYVKCNSSHGGPEYFQRRNTDPSFFHEEGAGALVDMGVHGLQIVTAIMGPAKRVSCMGKITTPVRVARSGGIDGMVIKADKIPDQYVILLDYGEGRMAMVDTGFSQKASKAPMIEIFCDKGTISFSEPYITNPMPEIYMDSGEFDLRGWMKPGRPAHLPKGINNQCCCLGDIVNAIEKDTTPVLSPEHARHVLEIMCKIPEAIEKGCTLDLETTF